MSSTTLPTEEKAIIVNAQGEAEITTIPFITPNEDQILIKSRAFALNPTDWKHIEFKNTNSIVGSDVAGEIVKVGKNVKGFEVGDHVSAFLHGGFRPIPYPAAFAEYVVANPLTTYKYGYKLKPLDVSKGTEVPAGEITSFEGAASLTLSLVTVGYSFYYSLGLDKSKDYSKESILIWSGSTAAGFVAIQVAKWLGFKNIVVTASKSRFELLKGIGATDLYDYNDADVVEQIKKAHPDIIYGLDTFATAETFNGLYASLSDSRPIFTDNLLFLNDSAITVPKKKHEVKFGTTLAYLVDGDDIFLFGMELKSPPGAVESHNKFHHDFQPEIIGKRIKHIPLKYLEGGYDGALKGLKIMKSGNYAIQKFVASA